MFILFSDQLGKWYRQTIIYQTILDTRMTTLSTSAQKLGKKFVKITGNKVPFHYLSMWKFYSNCYCSLVVLKTITQKEPGSKEFVLTSFKNPCKNDFYR